MLEKMILNNFIIISLILLLSSCFFIAYGNGFNMTKFSDPFQRLNFSYPSNLNIQYEQNINNNSNSSILYFPVNNSKYNTTFIEIQGTPLYNLSLKDHVFKDINSYISKYLRGDFISFRINNIDSNLSIDKSPAYKTEYRVILNDTFQNPVIISNYYTTDKERDIFYKLKFSEGGYSSNLFNDNTTKGIIGSFTLNTQNNTID